jgi:hypothetical protein
MKLIEDYKKALQAIYDHVGFKEDWVVCPIEDCTDMVWYTDGEEVRFANTQEDFYGDGDYYEGDVYKQRFYDKWIYRGTDFTMIFYDHHTDGIKWFALFDNKKEMPSF